MDSSTRQEDGALFQTNCPKLSKVLDLLSTSKYFRESYGANHFTLHSINQPMNYYLNLKCMEYYRVCYNCTKFSIDTYTKDMYPILKEHPEMHHKWRSIPFPSNFHSNPNVTKFLWKDNIDVHRKYAISYMGGLGITSRLCKELRIIMKDQCSKNQHCHFIDLESHTSQADIFQAQSEFPYGLYAESTFCLMPGGDFPTRKALVDALLSGCIPVTFNLFTGINQMPYHWGNTKNAKLVVINIPREQMMMNPTREFEKLISLSFNETFILSRRIKLSQIGHRFQYSAPTGKSNPQQSSRRTVDAVDIILRTLFVANINSGDGNNDNNIDNMKIGKGKGKKGLKRKRKRPKQIQQTQQIQQS